MQLNRIETPVVIIGAGPAGAATSIYLSKQNIRHVIIDKDVFPRDKVCGDACGGKTTAVIHHANPEWVTEMRQRSNVFQPSWGMTVVAPNGKRLDIPYSAKMPESAEAKGFIVPRMDLDNFLFEKLPSPYCTIFQGARVERMSNDADGVTVTIKHNGATYEIKAKVIVGADGDKSIVRKHFLSGITTAKTEAIGLRAYYEGITEMHPHSFIELHYFKEIPEGYFWIFPLPDGRANVGIGMLSATVREKKVNLREVMLKAIKTNPRIAHRFKNARLLDKIQGWGVPVYTKDRPISGNNFILCGDSALMVDPFSGEGIGNAMFSGMLAANAIKKAVDAKDYSEGFFKKEYETEFYKELGAELKHNGKLQRVFRYQWVFNMVFNKAYKSITLKRLIICMFTDISLQKQISKPSFYLKVLFNR